MNFFSSYNRLDELLTSIRITESEVLDVPRGMYVLDLLVVRAVIEPKELLRDEPALLDLLKNLSELVHILENGTADQLSYLNLGLYLSSQERAFKLMAALVTLSRAKLLTMRDMAGIMGMPELKMDYQTAVDYAKMGYVSIIGVNLSPEEKAEKEVRDA